MQAHRELRMVAMFAAVCCGVSMSVGSELFTAVFGAMGAFAYGMSRKPSSEA
jgi:hypothetical protein